MSETSTDNSIETTTKEDVLKGLKIVYERGKKHKHALLLFAGLAVFSTLGNSAVPYLTGKAFDAIISSDVTLIGGITATLAGVLILFGIVQGITHLVDWRLDVHTQRLGYEVQGEYIHDALRRLFKLPLSFHRDTKLGDTTTRIHRARHAYRQLFGQITQIVPAIASILVAGIFVFFINTKLALILVIGVILFSFIFAWRVAPTAKLMREVNDVFSDLFGDAWDALRNPRLVKLVQTEDKEADEVYNDFNETVIPTWLDMYTIWESLSFMQRMVVLLTQIAILVMGAPLVSNNVITVGELIAFNGYAALVYGPFVRLGYQWQQIQNGLLEVVKSKEMLDTPAEDYEGGETETNMRAPIRFDNVSFTYEEDEGEVLEDISFGVGFGKTVAIVGESGEGKSTLVDLIPRFIEPTSGAIHIGDTDIMNINLRYLRSEIALVPQRITLFNRTIRENMTYGLDDVSEDEMIEAAKHAQAHDFITDTYDGYESVVGEKGLKFSAGESQRIALARAFLADPAILILDEPTSALDAKNEQLITEVLEDLWEERTTFIIAHRLSTVHNADTILVLKDGTIAEMGTHEELIEQDGEYKRLHDLQIGLHE